MPDVELKAITTVHDFLIELEKGGALMRAWRNNKRAALDMTGLSEDLKKMILRADQTDDFRPVRDQIRKEKPDHPIVCLYVK